MTTQKVRDPVCGMAFDTGRAASRQEYRGTVYYFCSECCDTEFDRDPDRYATPPADRRTPPRVR